MLNRTRRGYVVDAIREQLLYSFEPKQEWLSHNSYYHGIGHMTRVFILQELICDQLERRGVVVNRQATRWAASVHDVGRIDDGVDPEHGWQSAKWMTDNLADKMSPELLDMTTYIVHWHVPPDSEAPVMTTELQALKDADALDRVRLGDLNVSYLRTDAAKGLVDIAQQLYDLSRPKGTTDDRETFQTVLSAAKQLGLIQA